MPAHRMSILAFLGLRHPVRLLPLLLFESAWKVLWLALVALPRFATGTLDDDTTAIVANCSVVVVILVVVPWRFVGQTYVKAPGARCR